MKPTLSTALLSLLALTPSVSAEGAHFQKQGSSATINPSGSLTIKWREQGLGNQLVNYDISLGALAQYACINRGGQHPKAENKVTVSSNLNLSVQLQSDRNGGVSGSKTIEPLDKGAFGCPSGQDLVLAKVCYSDVKVQDTTNGVGITLLAGQQCKVFVQIS